jgi:ephrin-B
LTLPFFLFQWTEESFTNFQKNINWRSYVVCDVHHSNVNNWLWSPPIDRGNANRLYIEIHFTIRDCTLFPGKLKPSQKKLYRTIKRAIEFITIQLPTLLWRNCSTQLLDNWAVAQCARRSVKHYLFITLFFLLPFAGSALSCKETFSLMFFEFEAATREPPPWQPESYKLIGRIAAGEGRFNQNKDVDINMEVKSIPVSKKGVYFAFRDQGACISILAVKVYYITCPAVTVNFAHFNETPTSREIALIEQQTGHCVENAEATETPTYVCKGDGKWSILTGGCKCKVGFEPDHDKQTCNVCPAGKFRSQEVKMCTPCPLNSKTNKPGSTYCSCLSGYYRHPRDGRHMPCYKPPGPPTNLTLLFIDQTTAILSWNAPQRSADEQMDKKYRSDIVFRVKCSACTSNVVFNPSSETFNDTKLTLTNLEPVTTYTVQIHSQNGLSYPIASDMDDMPDTVKQNYYHGYRPTEAPNSYRSNDVFDDIKTKFAEITFTTESAILSTVFNVK